MANSFDIPFNGAAEQVLAKARKAIESNKGSMTGDNTTGSFSLPAGLSKIKGKYTVEADKLRVEIVNKPIYVSNGMIEDALKKHMS
ncbi:MAG: hypothetical protein R2822_15675 [Spirosomataceae bacterium]